jgi:hypothetical protein
VPGRSRFSLEIGPSSFAVTTRSPLTAGGLFQGLFQNSRTHAGGFASQRPPFYEKKARCLISFKVLLAPYVPKRWPKGPPSGFSRKSTWEEKN